MPATLTYPGVYIEEIPSGVHTITGVATSITVFVGRTLRGPTDEDDESPVTINSFADFERIFGGLWAESSLGFAVRDFYLNGGKQAAIVRLANRKDAAGNDLADKEKVFAQIPLDNLALRASNPGKWGASLRVSLDVDVSAEAAKALGFLKAGTTEGDSSTLFNLMVRDASTGAQERLLNLTLEDKDSRGDSTSRRVDRVLKQNSNLLRWKGDFAKPATPLMKAARDKLTDLDKAKQDLLKALSASPQVPATIDAARKSVKTAQEAYDKEAAKLKDKISLLEDELAAARGTGDVTKIGDAQAALDNELTKLVASIEDGGPLDSGSFVGPGKQSAKAGLYALERLDLFNILCIPPYKPAGDGSFNVEDTVIAQAASYCEDRRAFYVIDPPPTWKSKDDAREGIKDFATTSKNAAVFFPRLLQPNPFHENRIEEFVPCGAIAGIFARTDTNRGVWKAPAGLEASLVSVPELAVKLTDAENGELNPKGVNCLRAFPSAGRVLWGSRTLQGADSLASEWKYIPVRRTALFIEESLYRGTQWVVFEPNDEPLWAQIRLNIGAFMHGLFRQGAFQGTTPRDAYFVKCDKETTTQADINLGIVNIIVGFAPLKPAEFVVIKIQQMAGQIET
jgi:phage tail sheath protein FI